MKNAILAISEKKEILKQIRKELAEKIWSDYLQ